jgi:hypothetical protein
MNQVSCACSVHCCYVVKCVILVFCSLQTGSLHVRVRRDANEQEVLQKVTSLMAPHVAHLTVQVTKDDWSLPLSTITAKLPPGTPPTSPPLYSGGVVRQGSIGTPTQQPTVVVSAGRSVNTVPASVPHQVSIGGVQSVSGEGWRGDRPSLSQPHLSRSTDQGVVYSQTIPAHGTSHSGTTSAHTPTSVLQSTSHAHTQSLGQTPSNSAHTSSYSQDPPISALPLSQSPHIYGHTHSQSLPMATSVLTLPTSRSQSNKEHPSFQI